MEAEDVATYEPQSLVSGNIILDKANGCLVLKKEVNIHGQTFILPK